MSHFYCLSARFCNIDQSESSIYLKLMINFSRPFNRFCQRPAHFLREPLLNNAVLYRTQRRRPSLLLRFVMVSGKTFTANTFLFMNWKITLQQKRFVYMSARRKMLQVSFFQQIKIASSFSAINLCFVINVLNNKTIILLNLAEYHLILANSAYGLVG